MEDFRLGAADFAGSAAGMSWRWVLTQPGGAFLDDHVVHLDSADWQYQAFTDPYGWVEHQADSAGDRMASERRAVAGLGDWIARRVFGSIAGLLSDKAPCAVRVVLPAEARDLAFLPFELARVDGRLLGVSGVSLVIDLGGVPPGSGGPLADRLRVLGLFSLPDTSAALNLRRERHELERLVGELAGSGRVVRFRSLQYGATRQMLTDAVEDGEGWDVVHLSGHGKAGTFVLERPDGSRDPVTGEELVELLSPLRPRVKLVTLSSCDSAERVARRQLELLAPLPDADAAGTEGADGDPGGSVKGLAPDLARRLGSAVVGMRYPVAESFAAVFAGELYRLLFDKGMLLPKARATATATAAAGPATVDRPALSAGVLALYGASALGLRLAAPRTGGPVRFTHEATKLAGFPPEPARFVGRVAAMARAGQALAPRSGRSAIVLHGMAEIGKTTFALELAYTQRDNFPDLIWHAVTQHGTDNIAAAAGELAATLDQKIDCLGLGRLLDDKTKLRAFLPRLTELFERNRLLLVIDNADPLLTATSTWRDDRMELIVQALTGHAGLGRVIITARREIAGTNARAVLAEPVTPLPRTEAVLLARELPRLCALLDGEAPPLNQANARGLAWRVLNAARGHPRLLEAADEQAADPAALAMSVLAAEKAWREYGGALGAGTSPPADPPGYLAVLGIWARSAAEGNSPAPGQ